MVKPFSFAEPLAHIWALLRREKTVKLSKLKVGDLVLDPASRDVYRRDKEIYLTPKEYRLLDYVMRSAGRVCTRTMIGEHIWGYNFSIHESNVVDVTVGNVRRKVDCGFENKLFHTCVM
jgi:DNA-binding response OmpR family regulator